MTKKITSTSNVPNNNSGNSVNSGNNSVGKVHKSPQKPVGQGSVNGIINAKHLHNQTQPQKQKNKRESSGHQVENGENNVLMKKLAEAVQKQKEKEQPKQRSRKPSAPLPKSMTMNSSETYAGAAFDRAPAATSFPIPSFFKTGETEREDSALSTSCPLPSLESKPIKINEASKLTQLKNVSITELFKTEDGNNSEKEEKKKLENLTNDLRRMLNLR